MNRRPQLLTLSLAALLATAIGTAAYAAASVSTNDAQPAAAASAAVPTRITLAQAVTAAEQHVQGQAMRAELERTRQGWSYDVEVVKGQQVFDVRVDAAKGAIVSFVEDTSDRDDHDERD